MKLPNMSLGVMRFTRTELPVPVEMTSNTGIQPQQSCRFCNGIVRGFQEEQQYVSCYSRCRTGGGSHLGCDRTCCCEVTGCYSCIFA